MAVRTNRGRYKVGGPGGSSRSKVLREELAQFKRQEGDTAGQGVVNRRGVEDGLREQAQGDGSYAK